MKIDSPLLSFRTIDRLGIYFFLFALSGFAGLIYESVWTHYLKLFLGHAAYAQTLVLAIFMGGMALGAYIVSRYTRNLRNLLLGYAAVELVIGLCALIFHSAFTHFVEIAFDRVIPSLGSPDLVDLFKWVSAACLILPQSMLLGMTFPLMSGGILRRFPECQGGSLAMLYFTNSIGAASGALVSGFWLIGSIGLPGTMTTAGMINIALALIIFMIARSPEKAPSEPTVETKATQLVRLFIAGAFLTGAASFIYELAWIRMLSMVLGSSFHAFELMLSAFITGLALGGLWIKRRIDSIENPVRFSGYVQIIMGLLALMTIAVYNHTFDWMSFFFTALEKSSEGYILFNLSSHLIAFSMMLPASFMAGMTLPLFTHTLIRKGQGEKSIGRIYASNTVGAIFGILFAVHIGMPNLGLKLLIVTGVLIDLGLGIALLRFSAHRRERTEAMASLAICTAALAFVLSAVHIDLNRLTSGVYRTGNAKISEQRNKVQYFKDGKTASIGVFNTVNNWLTITTNGKPDASITMNPKLSASQDEITMMLAAALPLSYFPEAESAANIGMGSGMTTHTLLTSPRLKYVDTIEIESAMVEGARIFGPRIPNTFSDPRSRIHIEDAKTFFAKHQSKYDIIISEPSNPWVSGVATLFSEQFYRHIKKHLTEKGLLVQWMQLYEIDVNLVSSVIKALDKEFDDYVIYNTDLQDILIIAKAHGRIGPITDQALESFPRLRHELAMLNLTHLNDLEIRRIGDRALLQSLFELYPAPGNSDYYPILEQQAPKSRFLGHHAVYLSAIATSPLPLVEMLGQPLERSTSRPIPADRTYPASNLVRGAIFIRDFLVHENKPALQELNKQSRQHLINLRNSQELCDITDPDTWHASLHWMAETTLSWLSKNELEPLWGEPAWLHCSESISLPTVERFTIYRAISRRDAQQMSQEARKAINREGSRSDLKWRRFLLATAMLGDLAQGKPMQARELWDSLADQLYPKKDFPAYQKLLFSHSLQARDRLLARK